MKKVMFVCKKNSCRSQMAEGFARTLSNGKIKVTSAGLVAGQVHPVAIQVMSEIGIDISNQISKPLNEFYPKDYDAVISLCGCGVYLPSEWLVQDIFQDWDIDDPDGQPIEIFRCVRDQIKEQVTNFITSLKRNQFLYARPRYQGEPENLAFDAKLQDFAQRVSYIAALEGNGKMPSREAYEAIELLWDKLSRCKV